MLSALRFRSKGLGGLGCRVWGLGSGNAKGKNMKHDADTGFLLGVYVVSVVGTSLMT